MVSRRDEIIKDYEVQIHNLSLDLIEGRLSPDEYDAEIAQLKNDLQEEQKELDRDT